MKVWFGWLSHGRWDMCSWTATETGVPRMMIPPRDALYRGKVIADCHGALRDIEKRTVLFKDNFDNTAKEPVVRLHGTQTCL